MTDKQKRLCTVMGLDLLVLQEMEWNGILLDKEKCELKAKQTQAELDEVTKELVDLAGLRSINLDSPHQLSCLLYGGAFSVNEVERVEKQIYKSGARKGMEYDKTYWKLAVYEFPALFTPLKGSETKLKSKVGDKEYPIYSTGEDILKQLKKPTAKHRRIIELLLKRAELSKLMDTYYGKLPEILEKMEWGDILHGQYNQVVAATGRLSSSNPNMQNFSGPVDGLLITRYVG